MSKARERRWRGMNRQQMQNPAAEHINNVRQALYEVAEFSGWWNNGKTKLLNLLDLIFEPLVFCADGIFRRAKQPRERAVNSVRRAVCVWVNGNSKVRSVRPVLPIF